MVLGIEQDLEVQRDRGSPGERGTESGIGGSLAERRSGFR